jgi:hypothetical protein
MTKLVYHVANSKQGIRMKGVFNFVELRLYNSVKMIYKEGG